MKTRHAARDIELNHLNAARNRHSDTLTMWLERARRNHVCVTYVLTFLVVLPILFRNSPFSLYFVGWSKQRLVEKATEANEVRFREAARYLSGLDKEKTSGFYGRLLLQDAIDVTVAVVTVKRSGGTRTLGYLTQVVAELDKIFKADVHFKKAMFVCNTFAGPGKHDEAEDLARYFPVDTRYPRGNVQHAIRDVFEKEKRDYVYCLQKALQYPTNHVIMLEDDAVPRRDMLDVLKHVLDTRVERRHRSGDLIVRDWAYVKLFHPDRWLGYTRGLLHVIELMSIGAVGGSLYLLAALSRSRSPDLWRLRRKYMTFLCGAAYCILVAVAIGRQNVHAVHRLSAYFYSVSPSPDCCSPAILFNAETAIEIGSHLEATTCNSGLSLDLAMSQFARAQGFTTLLVQPNVVRHIGLVSTLKGVSDVPEQFAFLP